MIAFCKIQIHSGFDDEPNRYFGFFDSVSDTILSFNGEMYFPDEETFLLYAKDDTHGDDIERYTSKILDEYK